MLTVQIPILLCLLSVTLLEGQSPVAKDYTRAVQLVGQSHTDDAIPILESVITQAPGFYPAYNELVEAYQQKHTLQHAEAYFTTLLRDQERSAFANYALGRIAELRSSQREAVDHYTACVQQRPKSVPCYVPLASSLMIATGQSATIADLAARTRGNQDTPYSCLAFTNFFRAQRKIKEGIEVARHCLAQAEILGDGDFLVAAHDMLAGAFGDTGADYDQTLIHNIEATRLAAQLDDPEAAFYHKLDVCADYVSLDRYAEAQECFGQTLTVARSQDHRQWLAASLGAAARAHKRRGELGEALAELSEVSEIENQSGDFGLLAANLLEIAKIHFLSGDLQQSSRFCQDALDLTRGDGLHAQRAYVLRELSKVYSVSGDPIRGLRYANQSIGIFRELGMYHQAGAGVGNLPEIYAFMGDWPSALRYARESLQSAKDRGDVLELQDTLATVGAVQSGMGAYQESVRSFHQSLELGRSTHYAPFRLSALMGLGSAYLNMKEFGHAESRLQEALQLARELGDRRAEANTLVQLGRCYRQFGSFEVAREYFETALKMATRIPLAEVTLIAQRGLAEMAMLSGDFHRALEHLESAAKDVELLRIHIPTADLKADFGQENSGLYDDLLYVLSRLDRREPGRGWSRTAFDYAERGRARAFLDLLAESRAQITRGLPAGQVGQRNVLEARVSRAVLALMERDSDVNQRAASLAESNLNAWITALHVTSPQYEALLYPRPKSATEAGSLNAALGGSILEYALGDHESYLWVVTAGQVRFIRLPPRATVERAVRDYRKLISNPPQGGQFEAWQAPAEALYNMLVKPAEPYLASQQPLVIVPDGILHYLPFETLRTAGMDGLPHCLIEQFPVSYMPSVSVLAELKQGIPDQPRKFDLLAYGDPIFSRAGAGFSSSPDLVSGIYASAGIHFPQLPNTRQEVERIGRLFPEARRTTFLGLEATESSVKSTNLLEYRLLHFATHAIIDDRNAARSGIVLSLVNTTEEDGILRMNEIFNLELNAELVVLSACRTGLATLMRGEGLIGLTRAFLYAGAHRVVVSLWDVNDLTTPDFMLSFYRRLCQREGPAAALRSAKIEMLHSDSLVKANPYFWAPFVLEAAPDPITKKN